MSCFTMSSLQKARQPAKRIFLRCLPHALLCITYLLYLIFGTLIFQAIEGVGSSELEDYLDEVANMRQRLEDAMWNESHGIQQNSTNWTKLLDEYTDMVSQPEWKLGRFHAVQGGEAWAFSSTMLFCLITITTIGYGDIIPVTSGGRIFLGFYATFGIPLNFIFLADIGFLLAKLIIATIEAGKTWHQRRKNGDESDPEESPGKKMKAARLPPRGMMTKKEKRPGGISASRAMSVHGPRSVIRKNDPPIQRPIRHGNGGISASTMMSVHAPKSVAVRDRKDKTRPTSLYPQIQDTSFIEDQKANDHANDGFENVALEIVPPDVTTRSSGAVDLVDSVYDPNRSPRVTIYESSTDDIPTKDPEKNISDKTTEISNSVVELHDDMDTDEESTDHTEVPLIIVLCILIVYVLVGAGTMAKIEGWDYGKAVYFTFITLTTIGFGDMALDNHYQKEIFFFCIIYIVFGLSVMSTCIALAQAKVLRAIDKFTTWIKSYCD